MAKVPKDPATLTDYLLERDPDLRRLSKKIQRHQQRLKVAIGLEHFRLYLMIEDTVNERCFALADRMWASARAQGRREGRRSARAGTERRHA